MANDPNRRPSGRRARRTFSGDVTRPPSRRRPLTYPVAPDWRDRVPPAVVRVLVGATFIALPAFEIRLGGLALPVVCAVLATLAGVAGWLLSRSEAMRSSSLNVTDAATLLFLTPVVAVASGIEVSDIRLGGAIGNFAAAAVAVLAMLGVVAVVAVLTSVESPRSAGIALLPAALTIAAVIAAAERFAADNMGQGFTAAWMIAALATLLDGVVNMRFRTLIPPLAFAVFAVVVAAAGTSEQAEVSRANATIAFLTTALGGAVLLIVPVATRRAGLFVTEPINTRVE